MLMVTAMLMLTGLALFFAGLFLGRIWADPHTIHFTLGEKVAATLMASGILAMAVSGAILIWKYLP